MKNIIRLLESAARVLSVLAAGLGGLLLLAMTLLPGVLGYKPYVVLSGSMSPAIPTGAVIFAVPVEPSTIHLGDVIMYDNPSLHESITHRVVDVRSQNGKPAFSTKGDANQAPDPWTVTYDGKAGKVVLSVPYVGYVYHALGTREGHLVFLIVPVVVLTILYLGQIWRPKQDLDPQERELPVSRAPAADLSPLKLNSSETRALREPAPDPGPTLPLRQ